MKVQIVEQVELFTEAELESLEFVPKELEAIEQERVPDLDSITYENIAEDLEAILEMEAAISDPEYIRMGQMIMALQSRTNMVPPGDLRRHAWREEIIKLNQSREAIKRRYAAEAEAQRRRAEARQRRIERRRQEAQHRRIVEWRLRRLNEGWQRGRPQLRRRPGMPELPQVTPPRRRPTPPRQLTPPRRRPTPPRQLRRRPGIENLRQLGRPRSGGFGTRRSGGSSS